MAENKINVTQKNIKDNIIHFWLDHLEIYATFAYEKDFFDSLDFDNSNVWELEDYVYTKTAIPNYLYKIFFHKDGYPVFAYQKGDKTRNIKTKDILIIHWTAFKVLSKEEILYFIEWYFKDVLTNRRFDICIDVPFLTKSVLAQFKNLKWKGAEFYDEEGNIATKYIWEKQNQKNKRKIIRVYNKILDIIASKKVKLFKDYLQFSYVTRIELEVRPEYARNTTYRDVFNEDNIKAIFKNYISYHTEIFNFISKDKIQLCKKKTIDISSEEYQWYYYKIQRKNVFLWHARTIYDMGFCPVRVLIGAWYIQEKTKLILWIQNVSEIIKKEKQLRNEILIRKIQREDFNNLVSSFPEYE